MSIATQLAALDAQRDALAANLTTKGVTASNTETLAQLVPKVLDVSGGGGAMGAVSVRDATTNVFIVTALTCSVTLPSTVREGDLILLGFYVRSALTAPAGYVQIDAVANNSTDQVTYLYYKIATAADIGATVVITQSISGRINASTVILKSTTGFSINQFGKTNALYATIPSVTASADNSVAVIVTSLVFTSTEPYYIFGSKWYPTTTMTAVDYMKLAMGFKLIDAGENTAVGSIVNNAGSYSGQIVAIVSPT